MKAWDGKDSSHLSSVMDIERTDCFLRLGWDGLNLWAYPHLRSRVEMDELLSGDGDGWR